MAASNGLDLQVPIVTGNTGYAQALFVVLPPVLSEHWSFKDIAGTFISVLV